MIINRKILALCLSVCIIAGVLSGCGKSTQSSKEDSDKLSVVTTIFPYYDFVRQIAGDKVNLKMIVPAGMDTHSFEPTASDMISMSKADVLIYNGGGMESWIPQVVDAASNPQMIAEAMMDSVDAVVEEHVEGMQEERGHSHDDADGHENEQKGHKNNSGKNYVNEDEKYGNSDTNKHNSDTEKAHNDNTKDEETEYDEHIWTSPVNACKIVDKIAETLSRADEKNANFYKKNADIYISKLKSIDTQFSDIVNEAPMHYLVFGDRFPLRYFVDEYGLDYSAAFAGCSSDTEPSADTIAFLIDKVKSEGVPVVLKIELTSSKVADSIAEATGTKVMTFYTCHNVTRKQFDQGVTYIDLMERDIDTLKKALGTN